MKIEYRRTATAKTIDVYGAALQVHPKDGEVSEPLSASLKFIQNLIPVNFSPLAHKAAELHGAPPEDCVLEGLRECSGSLTGNMPGELLARICFGREPFRVLWTRAGDSFRIDADAFVTEFRSSPEPKVDFVLSGAPRQLFIEGVDLATPS